MMKRSRGEKSPWLKPKSKPGPKKRKTCEFPDKKRKNLAESDKGSWFHQPSEIGEEHVDKATSAFNIYTWGQ